MRHLRTEDMERTWEGQLLRMQHPRNPSVSLRVPAQRRTSGVPQNTTRFFSWACCWGAASKAASLLWQRTEALLAAAGAAALAAVLLRACSSNARDSSALPLIPGLVAR